MSLHHSVLLHSSLPNRSTRRRSGLTLRYVPPSVEQVEPNSLGQRWRAIVVRGVDRYRHFEPREAPWPA
jgi:non-heme Fe2+,alpha-ketoglutarate-dependent halogenase